MIKTIKLYTPTYKDLKKIYRYNYLKTEMGLWRQGKENIVPETVFHQFLLKYISYFITVIFDRSGTTEGAVRLGTI